MLYFLLNIGTYTKGTRRGHKCIVKKFIHKRAKSDIDYKRELLANYQALKFAKSWFKFINSKSKKNNTDYKIIYIVQPIPAENVTETEITLSQLENESNNDDDDDDDDSSDNDNDKYCNTNSNSNDMYSKDKDNLITKAKRVYREEWIMIEPYLDGEFTKFNSNTGAVPRKFANHVLQAFSHFTYHISGGQMVFADVQGVEKRDMIILTDTCIISRKQGKFGLTDLGERGLIRFMINHQCNRFCDKHWLKPDPSAMVEELSQSRNPGFMRLDIDSQLLESE